MGGLALSSYLTLLTFISTDLAFCSPYSFLSCDEVIQSQYSRLLGIPVALVGAVGFGALFAMAYVTISFEAFTERLMALYSSLLALTGLAFGVYLTYLEFAVIGSLCILCFSTFLIVLPITALCLWVWRVAPAAR